MSAFEQSLWPLKSLGEVCASKELVNPKQSPEQPFRYIDIAGVSNQTHEVTEPKPMTGAEAPIRARKRVREGDVIVATTRPYLRAIARIPADLNGEICSTGFCVLRPTDTVASEWLFYCCLSDDLVKQLTCKMRGANYPAVSDKDVLAALVPVPPLPEQRRIVARIKECMTRIDEIRELRTQAQAEAEALFGVTIDAVLAGDWPQLRLSKLTTSIRNGWSGKQDPASEIRSVLRLSCVHGLSIDETDSKVAHPSGDVSDFCLRSGDVFVVRGNGSRHLVGRSAIALEDRDDVIFNDLLIRLRFKDCILPGFANFALHSRPVRDQVEALAKTAAGIWKINQTGVGKIILPVPPMTIQRTIVERLEEARNNCSAMLRTMAVEDKESLSGAILRKAFAGEL